MFQLWVILTFVFTATTFSGQQINPAYQINWPMITGSGSPSATCSSANYGQPYFDLSTAQPTKYTCTLTGWSSGVTASVVAVTNPVQTRSNVGSPGEPFPRWNAALAKVRSNAGFARLLVTGDSTQFGYLGGPAGNMVAFSWPVVACNLITTSYGVPCSADTWFGGGHDPWNQWFSQDARFTERGNFGLDETVPTIGYGLFSASGFADMCFAPTGIDDTMRVFYIKGPGLGVLHVKADGTTLGTINESAASYAVGVQTYNVSLSTHTWCLGLDSGSKVMVVGQEGYNSTVPSVIIDLGGADYTNSTQWADQTYPTGAGYSTVWSLINADLVTMENGLVNNWAESISAAQTTTDVAKIISAVQGAGADIAIITPVPSDTSVASQSAQTALVNAEKAVAATTFTSAGVSVPILDTYTAWGTWTNANANGWMADREHPNASGYAQQASLFVGALMQSSGKIGSPTVNVPTSSSNSTGFTFNHLGTTGYDLVLNGLCPNLTAGSSCNINLGKSLSANNSFFLNFYYAGAGSTSNYLYIAPYLQANAGLYIYANGTIKTADGNILANNGAGITVENTSTISGYGYPLTTLCPNLSSTGGGNCNFGIGKSITPNNAFIFNYVHLGDGNWNNYLQMGIVSSNKYMKITGQGVVTSPNGAILDDGSGNIGTGATTLYRCTTAGTLPVGALTTATGNCGASTDTGLRSK